MRRTAIIAMAAVVLISCTKQSQTEEGDRIGLRAAIGDTYAVAKSSAQPYRGNTPSESSPLAAAVWLSYEPDKFQDDPQQPEFLPCHTTVTFEGADIKYVDCTTQEGDIQPVRYPTPAEASSTNESVYCIGLHPQEGWTSTDEYNSVSHSIDGVEDLMFADVIEGLWNNKFGAQTYGHLLTWIKISICATTPDAASHWGKVTSLSISSKENVTIDFDIDGSTIGYSGNDRFIDVDLQYMEGEPHDGLPLSITSREAGSAFCSPSTQFRIKVATENHGEKVIEIGQLTDVSGNAIASIEDIRGKLFIISLYFSPYDIIRGTCTLNYWNDQSEDLYLTED